MISRGPVVVSVCRVGTFVVLYTPVEGPWVLLVGTRGVRRAALVCRARVEAVVEGAVCRTVALVDDTGAELLSVLLSLKDEVASTGDVVVVAAVVVVGAMVVRVFSSVKRSLLKRKSIRQLTRTEKSIKPF